MESNTCIFFWKENNKYGYLSNFYYSTFYDSNNIKYICNEQYFMSKKCLLFDKDNIELYNKIMTSKVPIIIKRLGKKVKNFDQIIWDKEKYKIMKIGLNYKFSQNNILKRKLLKTKNKKLYESSKYNNIWGIGLDYNSAKYKDSSLYPGENLLGKALMEIRDKL